MITTHEFRVDDKLREILPDSFEAFPCFCKHSRVGNNPGDWAQWHWHQAFEIDFCLEGSIHFRTPDTDILMKKGNAVFVNSNTLHQLEPPDPGSTAEFYTLFFDGELLSVFGSKGNLSGQFKTPSTIAWLGDKLVIGDSALKCAYIMEPSEFGQALLDANEAYYYGRWDEATAHFERVLRLCSNLETAYVGIGKNLLMQEEYRQAMDYFKLGSNREFYSKAYKGYRSEVLRDHFGVIAVIGAALIVLVIGSEISYNRKQRRGSK